MFMLSFLREEYKMRNMPLDEKSKLLIHCPMTWGVTTALANPAVWGREFPKFQAFSKKKMSI